MRKIVRRGLIVIVAILIVLISVDMVNDAKAKNDRIASYNSDLYYAVYEVIGATDDFENAKNKEKSLEEISESMTRLGLVINGAKDFFYYDYVDVRTVEMFDFYQDIDDDNKISAREIRKIKIVNQITKEILKKLKKLTVNNTIVYYPLETSKKILESACNDYEMRLKDYEE